MMSKSHLFIQNIKKNMKHYTMYIFALILSVALYYSFSSLQYNSLLNELKDSTERNEVLQSAAILLTFIIIIFVIYANTIFIRRRSKDIALFQLFGMTKGQVFNLLNIEAFIIYFLSLLIGIFIGFSFSKVMTMALFKIISFDATTKLQFSWMACKQTVIVFMIVYLFIFIMNYLFIKKQDLIKLFQSAHSREEKEGKTSIFTPITGLLGIILLATGYTILIKLFSGNFQGKQLLAMIAIIFISLLIGTYLFYKTSVRYVLYFIRKKKNGYVSLSDALSYSAIMFRMQSQALLLTVITIVSAFAVGLSSLAYISYYSAEKSTEEMVPDHFSLFNEDDAKLFIDRLEDEGIPYRKKEINSLKILVDITPVLKEGSYEQLDISEQPELPLMIISAKQVQDLHVKEDEVILTAAADPIKQMLDFKETGEVIIHASEQVKLNYVDLLDRSELNQRITNGFPSLIVHETIYKRLAQDETSLLEHEFPLYIGINMKKKHQVVQANDIFHQLNLDKWTGVWAGFESQLEVKEDNIRTMGLFIFITGFLGLTFLVTSSCILYFKQIDEAEESSDSYMIFKKLGFTEDEMIIGIRRRQLFNFGLPLILSLLHSYFLVKSGWFIFGQEMWIPMFIVMSIYTILYCIFGLLATHYHKIVMRKV